MMSPPSAFAIAATSRIRSSRCLSPRVPFRLVSALESLRSRAADALESSPVFAFVRTDDKGAARKALKLALEASRASRELTARHYKGHQTTPQPQETPK